MSESSRMEPVELMDMDPALPRSMFPDHARDTEHLIVLGREVGLRLRANLDQLTDGVNRAIENSIDELDDDLMRQQLHASVAGNVRTIVDLLVTQGDVDVLPPIPAAVDYAVTLARNNVSGSSLRRAYHKGSEHLLAHMFEQIQNLDVDHATKLQLSHYLTGWTYKYVDSITRTVTDAYDQEVLESRTSTAHIAAVYVDRILGREPLDPKEFHRVTGHGLAQFHLGAIMWIDGAGSGADRTGILTTLAHRVGELFGGNTIPLVTPIDRASVRVWFGRGEEGGPVATELIRAVVEGVANARVAIGAPAYGLSGFRHTIGQAEHVAVIGRTADTDFTHVVSYSDEGIPIIALTAGVLGPTRRWVNEILGPLAQADEHAERLRRTVLTFYANGSNITETAKQLLMHRNSVKYRLDSAEDELGRSLNERTLDTRMALQICQVLGGAVLGHPPTPPPGSIGH